MLNAQLEALENAAAQIAGATAEQLARYSARAFLRCGTACVRPLSKRASRARPSMAPRPSRCSPTQQPLRAASSLASRRPLAAGSRAADLLTGRRAPLRALSRTAPHYGRGCPQRSRRPLTAGLQRLLVDGLYAVDDFLL